MDAQISLCDWAEVVNQKLYIMGAGWTRLAANQPTPMAVAVHIHVPWTESNKPHSIELLLLTEDGAPAAPALPPGAPEAMRADLQPIRMEGKFEVGRPPGTTQGSLLPALFAFRLPIVFLDPGRYAFQLNIDGKPGGTTPFEAIPGQTGG